MLIVSFYTDDWVYPEHAKRLAGECDRLGLPHRIEKLASTRSYLRNCCLKPAYIQTCLQDAKEPVLWVDVDASILAPPTFFQDDDPYDFQAKRMGPQRTRTWHVGTMWWNYTPEALVFIERWVANTGESTDESALEFTWRQDHNLRTRDIPAPYFRIMPDEAGAVIVHRLSTGEAKLRENHLAMNYERTVV